LGAFVIEGKIWFRDVDSNHDTQLQRLMSYQLDDPGTGFISTSLAEEESLGTPGAEAKGAVER
jgi:hypothetical protein